MISKIFMLIFQVFNWLYENVLNQSIYGIKIYSVALGALTMSAIVRFVIVPFFGRSVPFGGFFNYSSDKSRKAKKEAKKE